MQKDWTNIFFLTLTPILGIGGTIAWTVLHGFHWWMPLLTVALYLAVGMSICAGYHRLFSHRAYEASRPVQVFFAFFGALAAQNSILWWSATHRVHHKYVDRDWDPYSIKRGFWWAHILWVFYKNPKSETFENTPDLLANPVVMWQNRWHKAILILGGFGIPALVGAAFGDPIAGLLWGGFLRIVIIHHTTFFVNSLAHTMGKPLFNAEVSARDNWVVALLTLGEGYHSFHHRFPSDFRNGIRWYQWDPAKWFIGALRSAQMATGLVVTPEPQVESARMQAAMRVIEPKLDAAPLSHRMEIRQRLQTAAAHIETALKLWRQHVEERAAGLRWRSTRKRSKHHVRQSRRQWKDAVRLARRLPLAA